MGQETVKRISEYQDVSWAWPVTLSATLQASNQRRLCPPPPGDTGHCLGSFGSQLGVLPASSGQWPGMLLDIPQCAEQSPKPRTVWPPRSLRPDAVVGKLPHHSRHIGPTWRQIESLRKETVAALRVLTRASKLQDGNKEVQRPPHRQGAAGGEALNSRN